jgi:nicotinamide riboside kinase
VSEASRDYLDQKLSVDGNFRYDESHLLEIASQQDSAEQLTLAGSPDRVICDTDLLVMIIWSEVRFGQCHPLILETFARRIDMRDRHYLLCDCDIPWQPDPLRESADSRPELFALYQQKLDYFELPYTVMRGDQPSRLKHALEVLENTRSH